MNRLNRLSRRRFFGYVTTLAAGLALPPGAAASAEAELEQLCLAAAADPEITQAGRLCISNLEPVGTRSELVRNLAAEIGEGDLIDGLHSAVRRDFARGDIVSVDGWRLSVTEARFYAAAFLVKAVGS